MKTTNIARWAWLIAGMLLPACEIHEAAPPPTATIAGGTTTAAPTSAPTVTPTVTPTAAPTTAPTSAPTGGPAQGGAALAGEWLSPSCGERKYPRRLSLDEKKTFQAQDLVSPCPKGVSCVWSGIVQRKGTWSSDGKTLKLVVEGNAGPQGAPFPASIDLAPGPVERDGAGQACAYQRVSAAAK